MTEIFLTGTLNLKSNNQSKVKTVTLEALWMNRLHCFPRANENSTSVVIHNSSTGALLFNKNHSQLFTVCLFVVVFVVVVVVVVPFFSVNSFYTCVSVCLCCSVSSSECHKLVCDC